MIAWRGVVEGDRHPELMRALHADFTNLHQGLIFDISSACCMNVHHPSTPERFAFSAALEARRLIPC